MKPGGLLKVKKYSDSYFSYFLMYAFYYLGWALFSSLISIYLLGLGFKHSQVAIVLSSSYITSMIVQPLIGRLCDTYTSRKVNIVLFLLAAVGGLAFIFAKNFIAITIGYSFVIMLVNGTNPAMERVASSSKYAYGKIRIWGTIGYAAGTQLAGILYKRIAPSAIFIAFVISFIISAIGAYGTVSHENIGKVESSETNQKTEFYKNKEYISFLIISALFAGITSVSQTFLPAMLQNGGLDISTTSTILSIAVLFEMPLIFFSNKFMDKFSTKSLILICWGMLIMQFISYGFHMPMLLQILLTLLVKHPSGMLFIMINVKAVSSVVDAQHQVTALALVQTARNLMSVLMQNGAGVLLDHMSYAALFKILLIPCILGIVFTYLVKLPKGTDSKTFS